ncbi:hypothetical protein AYO44_00140 [Planctomycetaceae bacterium SCGC AG-212-F19]|nr:hypothetical protein AYO44_00140 [Planctomycetaceae bacterium SCGC AG-212-F19]
MNCNEARDLLLRSDDPQACAAPEIAGHLAACDACRSFVAQLAQLESAYRALPAPAEAETARVAFLEKLPRPALPAKPQAAPGWLARWAVAALLLLAVGAVVWTLAPTPEARASAVIEELIDWNLNLAQAPDAAERGRIFASHEAQFKRAVDKSKLSPDDRELAGLLLDNGSWLAANDDPVDSAERFSAVADKLVERLEVAAKGKDRGAVDRYAKLQGNVNKRGVGPQLARAEESGALNFDRERRLEKVVLRDSKRMHTLVDMLEHNPDLSRKEIRQALDIPAKAGKHPAGLVFDLEAPPQPAAVGQPVNYVIKLHNQGAPVNKVQLVVTLPDNMELISAKGPAGHRQEGRQLIFRHLATLAGGGDATFEINAKPLRPGASKCRAELRVKQTGYRPVWREQAVTVIDNVP